MERIWVYSQYWEEIEFEEGILSLVLRRAEEKQIWVPERSVLSPVFHIEIAKSLERFGGPSSRDNRHPTSQNAKERAKSQKCPGRLSHAAASLRFPHHREAQKKREIQGP